MWMYISSDTLCHHGIKGQRWGVRRFQNPDGTLTAAGRRQQARNVDKLTKTTKQYVKNVNQYMEEASRNKITSPTGSTIQISNPRMERSWNKAVKYGDKGNRMLKKMNAHSSDKYMVQEHVENGKVFVELRINNKVASVIKQDD